MTRRESRLTEEAKQFAFLLKTGGLGRTWAHVLENIIRFDLKYGTKTATWVDWSSYPRDLKNVEHLRRYRAGLQSAMKRAIHNSVGIYGEHDIVPEGIDFRDAGSGKGKTLGVASLLYPFNSVTGIEFNPDLNVIARRNLSILGTWHDTKGRDEIAERMRRAKIFEGDIVDFTGYGQHSLVYAYFPFDKEITAVMKARIEANSETCVLALNYPEHEDVFADDSSWTRRGGTESKNPDKRTHIYAYGLG